MLVNELQSMRESKNIHRILRGTVRSQVPVKHIIYSNTNNM